MPVHKLGNWLIINCDLLLKCMLVCGGRPPPGCRLIDCASVIRFLNETFQSNERSIFVRKHLTHACSSMTLAVSQLLIIYLSPTVRSIVTDKLSMTLELCYRYRWLFIRQFNNFVCVKYELLSCVYINITFLGNTIYYSIYRKYNILLKRCLQKGQLSQTNRVCKLWQQYKCEKPSYNSSLSYSAIDISKCNKTLI